MSKETCVVCGRETTVDVDTHIDFRDGYIVGFGQLCIPCNNRSDSNDTILIPKDLITKYPNNYELGEKIREFYHLNYNK